MGLLDDILNSYGGGGLLGSIPAPQAFASPGPPPMTDTERQLMAMVQPQPQAAPPMFAQAPQQQPMTDTERQMMAMVQPPMTPTEQKLMAMVRPGGGAVEARPQDSLPMTPTERQMMAMVQPSGAAAPPPAPPQTPRPPQAGPIAVGDYMMPRVGPASAYEPQAGPTDVSARAVTPPAAATPTGTPAAFMEPPSSGGFGGFGRGALANMQGGPLGMLFGGIAGAAGMGQGNPRDIERQNQKAQYEALIANGLTKQQAMLAILNPEAGKTLINEALTNKEKYGVVSEDPLQGKQYGFINEREQTVNGKPIGQQKAGADQQGLQSLTDRISSMRESGASRDQLLSQIPTGYRDNVNSLITGKGVPANMGRAQSRMAILTLAKVVDPNFDETMIPTRLAMRKDFSGEGKNGQAIGSFNTAQHHIEKLSNDLEGLAKYNGDYPSLNSVRGWLANNANMNPKMRDSMQAVNDDMAAVSHEIGNAYNSGHLSDHDMATWQKLTSTNLPPDQLRRGISDFVDLLNGKRDSLNHMHRQTFGEDAPTIEKERNAAITSLVHQRLPEYAKNQAATASTANGIQEGATATNPQTGQKLTFRGGKWQ